VKRADLLRRIERAGAVFVREGGSHTIYENPYTSKLIAVPRHREINEHTSRAIIRDAEER